MLEAGYSYFAFNATMQIVTQKTNDKKSYSSISNAPFQGQESTAYRLGSTIHIIA